MERIMKNPILCRDSGFYSSALSPATSATDKRTLQERDARRLNRRSRLQLNNKEFCWYCLYVPIGKEIMVQKILANWLHQNCDDPINGHRSRVSAEILVPLEERWHRTNRYSRRKTRVCYPVIAGCLFLGVPVMSELLFRILNTRLVNGVLSVAGNPAVIQGERISEFLKRIRQRKKPDNLEQGDLPAVPLKRGDRIKLSNGPFRGLDAEVSHINNSVAWILMELLGSDREVSIPLCDLQNPDGGQFSRVH